MNRMGGHGVRLGFGLLILAVLSAFAGPVAEFATSRPVGQGSVVIYLGVAVTALTSSALIFAPGILLALGLSGPVQGMTSVVLKGLIWSLLWLTLAPGAIGMALAQPLTGAGFSLFLVLSALPGALLVARRGLPEGVSQNAGQDMAALLAVPLLLLAVLLPKFVWENFNGDGVHSYYSLRNMVLTGTPFWPKEAGDMASYPSLSTSSAVVFSSFTLRFFGENELSARLSVLPQLSFLTVAVLGLVRWHRPAPLGNGAVVALVLALVLFAATLGWHATYHPSFADIALPLAREPLVVVAALGVVWFFLQREYLWLFAFLLLLLLSIPSAVGLIGMWLGAVFLVWRPIPWKRLFLASGLTMAAMAVTGVAPMVMVQFGLPVPGDEFSSGNLLRRLRFVSVAEVERFWFWLVPCGLLPGLAVLTWFWQDRLSRALSLVALGYFALFYLQAYRVLPHHFAPVPILSLIVFWRLAPVVARPQLATGLALVGVVAGLWLARPDDWAPNTASKSFAAGWRLEDMDPAEFRADDVRILQDLLSAAFSEQALATQGLVRGAASPVMIYYYVTRSDLPEVPPKFIVREGAAQPGEVPLAEAEGYVLVATSQDAAEVGLLPTLAQSSVNARFYVPRRILFGTGPRDGPRPVWDLAALAGLR
ncbi:hypothetical protein [Meridianimarinicoccus marinus]